MWLKIEKKKVIFWIKKRKLFWNLIIQIFKIFLCIISIDAMHLIIWCDCKITGLPERPFMSEKIKKRRRSFYLRYNNIYKLFIVNINFYPISWVEFCKIYVFSIFLLIGIYLRIFKFINIYKHIYIIIKFYYL